MAETRVTNNESRRDAPRPNRVVFPDQGGRLFAPTGRVERSPFQKLLDDTSQNVDRGVGYKTGQSTTTPETREAVRAVPSRDERSGGREKEDFRKRTTDRESDREKGKTEGARDSGLPRVREAEKRVIAKGPLSERRHQGQGHGGGQKEGGGGSWRRGKLAAMPTELKGIRRAGVEDPSRSRFALEMEGAAPARAAAAPKPKATNILTKALLDQLVQYCRLVTKTDGDKEFDLQLHEEVFRGLKLRVAMAGGKIEVTFFTPSEEVEGLFQARKSELLNSLAEKGIDVRSIHVVMV